MEKTRQILVYETDYYKIRDLREKEITKTLASTTFADIIHTLLEK